MNPVESWGRYPKTSQTVSPVLWSTDLLPAPVPGKSFLPFGLGRTYGDGCLNDGGILLATRTMNRLLGFDSATGVIRCEAGASLDDILRFAVPRGRFLPVTPGTKFVTVGGAIANDVHGKNHHRVGTFGRHVRRLELLRSDGRRLICSPDENADYFAATIAGLGLTGLITWAEVALRPIESAFIDVESVKFRNLDEFFAVSAQSDKDFEFTVSWVDCLASGDSLGRGIMMRGNHAGASAGPLHPHDSPKAAIPFDFPAFAISPLSVKAFNTLYYNRFAGRSKRANQHYNPFFYPLDSVSRWNRIYGSRGFFQYQFTVPFSPDNAAVHEVFRRIARSGQGSFLAVLKTFGDISSPGLLSYPSPGITLALDFANQGSSTLNLFDDLKQVVMQAGGRFYPAKDAWMPADVFEKSYPNWREFSAFIDPAFSSSFWRRVTSVTGSKRSS
jgi:FAD/FMN-containing dehydrogenase